MKKTYYIFIAFLFLSTFAKAQIENVIVETYYIANKTDSTIIADNDPAAQTLEPGSVTYRIYVDLKAGSKLKKIYGDANHALKFASTAPFFNNVDGFIFANDFSNLNAHKSAGRALDTWLTIGQTARTFSVAGKAQTNYGILKSQDRNGSSVAVSDLELLNNNLPSVGIPLTVADGMDTIAGAAPTSWLNFGIKPLVGTDSCMFGSNKITSEFISNNAYLQNGGVRGVIADSNQVLIAQLTTKGELSFELNLEIEELLNDQPITVKYIAIDTLMQTGEKANSNLKYPKPKPNCKCTNARYVEFDAKAQCSDSSLCKRLIVFGCMDVLACNYDSNANFLVKGLCCYPGFCGGRDIATVCPQVNSDKFGFDVFPNPTNENLYLTTVFTISPKDISYFIYDAYGTLVLNKDLGKKSEITKEEIDLSHLKKGIYLFKIDYDGNVESKLFIKN